jgi:hypothetical protein
MTTTNEIYITIMLLLVKAMMMTTTMMADRVAFSHLKTCIAATTPTCPSPKTSFLLYTSCSLAAPLHARPLWSRSPHHTRTPPTTPCNKQQIIAVTLQSLSFDPNYLGDDDECDGDFDDDDGDDDDTFWKVRLVSSRLLASCARSGHVSSHMLLQTVLPPLLLRLQDRIDIVISESLVTFKELLHQMGPTRQQLTPADVQRFIKCLLKESTSKDARLQENLFAAGRYPALSAQLRLKLICSLQLKISCTSCPPSCRPTSPL